MRKLWLLCLLMPCSVMAQRLHLTLFGGAANYQGDLESKQFTLDQAHGAFGLGAEYDLTSHFAFRTGFIIGKVGADDKKNLPLLQPRNLNFQSHVFDATVGLQYSLFDLQVRKFTPYVFAGLGIYHYDPYTYDTLNQKTRLQPLGTEGQGLAQYPGRKMYKLTQLNIPMGGGIRVRVADNVMLGYEISMRKLFTDYLDDVSTTYVDQQALAQGRGAKAVELAYRGDELKTTTSSYPPDGTIRGGSKYKDWYYFQGITLSIGLNTGNGNGNGRRNGSINCPRRVW